MAIPDLIVSVTPEPRRTAPPNSQNEATMIACFKVSALAPTEVPKALATSLAPIPYRKIISVILGTHSLNLKHLIK